MVKTLAKCFFYPIAILMGTFVGGVLVVFGLAGFNILIG